MDNKLSYEQSKYLDNLCKIIFDIGNKYGELFLLDNKEGKVKLEELKFLISEEEKMYSNISEKWLIEFILYFAKTFSNSDDTISFPSSNNSYDTFINSKKDDNDMEAWNKTILPYLQYRIFDRLSNMAFNKDNQSSSLSITNDYLDLYTFCVLRDLIRINSNNYFEFVKYISSLYSVPMEHVIINSKLDPRNISDENIDNDNFYDLLIKRIVLIADSLKSYSDENLECISSNRNNSLEYQLLVLRSHLVLCDEPFKDKIFEYGAFFNINSKDYNVVCKKLNKVRTDYYYRDRELFHK